MSENLSKNRSDHKGNIDIVFRELQSKSKELEIAYRNIGSAYATAYQRHEATINAQNAKTQLNYEIAFGIFAGFGAGLLSAISTVAKSKPKRATKTGAASARDARIGNSGIGTSAKIPVATDTVQVLNTSSRNPTVTLPQLAKDKRNYKELLVEGAEDAMQTWMEVGAQSVAKSAAKSAYPMSRSPLQFQNDALNSVSKQMIEVNDMWNNEIKKWQARDETKYVGFDYKKNLKRMQKKLAEKFSFQIPKKIDIDKLAKEIESHMWAVWLRLHCSFRMRASFFGDPQKGKNRWTCESPGSVIEARLKTLQIVRRNFGDYWTSEREMKKLLHWADHYRPPRQMRF